MTITGGYAASGPGTSAGGGLLSGGVDSRVIDCTFKANTAYQLGGAALCSGMTRFQRCTFVGNKAGVPEASYLGNGGAIYTLQDSSTTICDCSFVGNIANDNGGAVYKLR